MPQIKNAADARGEWASGSDFGPGPRKGMGRTTDEFLGPGSGTGGGYDGEALTALADAYLNNRIRRLSNDNPYKRYVDARTPGHDWGTMGIGDMHEMVAFNKLAYGEALNKALRYELLRDQTEKQFGTNPRNTHAYERLRDPMNMPLISQRGDAGRTRRGGAA